MERSSDFINLSLILDRIEVQPPYFALERLKYLEQERIEARVPVQQPLASEIGYVTAAEAGRHLAILGSCFLSLMNPEPGKFFYLAFEAQYLGLLNDISTENPLFLLGNARGNFLNRRTAEVFAQLTSTGKTPVCDLIIKYHVFPQKVFNRLFNKNRCALEEFSVVNPYQNITPLRIANIRDGILTAEPLVIESKNCVGHFPCFPAMPIAILAHHLIQLSGLLLKHILKLEKINYFVSSVTLNAPNLGFANEKANFEVEYLKSENNLFYFRGLAKTSINKTIGDLQIVLSYFSSM